MNWYHTPRWAKCCPVRLKDKIYCTNTPFAVCVCSHVHLIPVEMRRFITNLQIGLGCKLHFFKCKTICSSGDMIVNISCSFSSFVNFPSFLKYTQVLSLSVTFCFLFADVQLCLLSINFCPEAPGRWDDTYTLGYISPILSYRAFSLKWPAALQIYWNRREFLHEKKVKTFRTGLGHQLAAVSLNWDTNVSAVTSCENALVLFFFFVFLILFISPSVSAGINRIDLTTKQRYFKHKRRMLLWLSSSSYLKAQWELRFKGMEKNSTKSSWDSFLHGQLKVNVKIGPQCVQMWLTIYKDKLECCKNWKELSSEMITDINKLINK